MQCPCCRTELVQGRDRYLETHEEHVCCPNGPISIKRSWECPNSVCAAFGQDFCWNDEGDFYGWGKDIPWIDGNNGAIPSFSRQMNIECYKHDEDHVLFTFPCWPWKGWQCRIEYVYKADEYGKILSRKAKWRWITPEGVWHMSGFSMFKFSLKRIWRAWRDLRKNPTNQWRRNELLDTAKRASWIDHKTGKPEWWRVWAGRFAKLALRFS